MFFNVKNMVKPLQLVLFMIFIGFPFSIKAQNINERYDPGLGRLTDLDRFDNYIDSLKQERNIPGNSFKEVFLINSVIERRFYHGYSKYSIHDNFLAYIAGKYIWSALSAIVIPNDILKHPNAACSQQAIIMMEVLKYRGYQVRKLGLTNHFILEVFCDNDWKVFDPNKEPTLQGFSHNAIPVYLQNGALNKAYSSLSENEVETMFKVAKIGKVNEFPAKNARLFHIVTKFISQYFVVFLVAFLLVIWFVLNKTVKVSPQKKLKNNFKKVSECQQKALAD
jgi:hypothetical protein